MQISIICATFNAGTVIGKLLQSIASQSFKEVEVIIVDGNSTDDTLDKIKEFNLPYLRIISEPDKGIYDAFNKGIKLSTGKWILFMGADDILADEHVLTELNLFLNQNSSADLVYGKVLGGKKSDILFNPKYSRKLLFINTIHHQGAVYKRSVFDGFSYNENFTISADYELNLKLFVTGRKAVLFDKVISVVGEYGVSNRVRKSGYIEEILIRKKYLENNVFLWFLKYMTLLRYFLKRYPLAPLRNMHLIHR